MTNFTDQKTQDKEVDFPKLSAKGKKWIFKKEDERTILHLMQKYGYPEILARFISQRCPKDTSPELFLTPKLRDFLPNPQRLIDMKKAVDRLISALEKKEKITIFGDYDVDGATSTSLLMRYLMHIGANVNFYIPDRVKEGYGPSESAFDSLKKDQTDLVITVDCGTAAIAPLFHAKKIGLDSIIIDHHIPEKTLPECIALINPNRTDDTSGYGYLCAAGVTFLFLVSLQSELKKTHKNLPDLRLFLDLVALGTVCDVVPLKGLNRAFVQQGLAVLNKQLNPGIKALCHVAGIEEKCTSYHLGYILGPHINAGGRIGKSTLGTELLTASSTESALPIAQTLNQLNQQRKNIEAKALDQALEMSKESEESSVLCLGSDEWHPGIIGIVAGRLKEKLHKPVFIIAFDETGCGKGSGRSIPGVNLGGLVQKAKDSGILIKGGGHAMAAGLSVEKNKVSELQRLFNDHVSSSEMPPLEIDVSLSIQGATIDIVRLIDRAGPFGSENPSPIFMIPNCQIIKPTIRGEKHVSCFLRSEDGKSLEAISFNVVGGPLEEILLKPGTKYFHIAGSLKVDTWQGRVKAKFYIEDIIDQSNY
jgi:single-stranded-DNA-specific exonuclease